MHTPEKDIVTYVEQVKLRYQGSLDGLMRTVTGKLEHEAATYLNPVTHLMKGWASREVPALAKQISADVLVMGTVSRTGVPGFIMGNTAETILRQIDCSVLAIKPPDFKTPVALVN